MSPFGIKIISTSSNEDWKYYLKKLMYGVPFIVYKSAFPYLEFRNSTSAYDEYETKRNKELPYFRDTISIW